MNMTTVIGARARHWHDFVVGESLQTVGRTIESGEVGLFAGLPERTRPTTAVSARRAAGRTSSCGCVTGTA
jgi:hypothetical protein